jgi:probable phosphoglycerate mutase
MRKTIYYLRHGETDWNRISRFQGHSDIPLNSKGILQAAQVREFFDYCRPDIFLSSDLQRAVITAKIANQNLQIPHLIDPRLREVHLGQAEGKTYDEAVSLWGAETLENWMSSHSDFNDFRFPGGETKKECVERIRNFLEVTMAQMPYQTIGVCGHGGTLKLLCQYISMNSSKAFPIPNCCIYKLDFQLSGARWSLQDMVFQPNV